MIVTLPQTDFITHESSVFYGPFFFFVIKCCIIVLRLCDLLGIGKDLSVVDRLSFCH